MKQAIIVTSSTIAALCLATWAKASDYYASPTGSGTTCSDASPCTLSSAMSKLVGGDTVYLRKGNYGGLTVSKSGSESAWITFAAYPGEVPYFTGVGVNGNYIRFDGVVSRNSQYTGFGNPYSGACAAHTAGNIQYLHCIADGNGINGIAHYCAPGVLVQQSIVAHNGAGQNSWSSGVNLYGVTGGTASNVVRETVAFDSWDSSSNHSDGSGFILDEHSEGATFINNLGFENGGSCIRLTNSANSLIVNNTCYGNAKDPQAQYNDEIMYSDATSRTGAILTNTISIPTTTGKNGIGNANGITQSNNVTTGAASIFVGVPGATSVDFNLTSSATSAIDKGTSTNAPSNDIGFDPKCITKATPTNVYVYSGYTMPTWWTYSVDYAYIEQIGGVAKCWKARARTSSPDIGAFEYNASPATGGGPATGGASGTGGTPGAGGTLGAGGAVSATGGAVSATGGSRASGGASPSGGSVSTGGISATGGAATSTRTGGATSISATGGTLGVGGTTNAGMGGSSVAGQTGGSAALGGAFGLGGQSVAVGGGAGGQIAAVGGALGTGGTVETSVTTTAAGSNSSEAGTCSCRAVGTRTTPTSLAGLGVLGLLVLRGWRRKR